LANFAIIDGYVSCNLNNIRISCFNRVYSRLIPYSLLFSKTNSIWLFIHQINFALVNAFNWQQQLLKQALKHIIYRKAVFMRF